MFHCGRQKTEKNFRRYFSISFYPMDHLTENINDVENDERTNRQIQLLDEKFIWKTFEIKLFDVSTNVIQR